MNSKQRYEVAAYYFPGYHADTRNDIWHGQGWTEWELVKAAQSRFPGHRQPLVPQWGYFDESDPIWAAREIDLAADHGITSFIYDWYWYEDKPFLQEALEKGFLRATNTQRLKFALMWANHDWANIHPAQAVSQPPRLAEGSISPVAFERLTDYVLEHYFSHPQYLTYHGEPYFSIYELGSFIRGLGGLDATRHALERFRAKVRAAGFPGLHLNVIVWGLQVLPSEVKLTNPQEIIETLGFSSTTSYAWVHHYNPNSHGFPCGSYLQAAEQNYQIWQEYARTFAVPYYPNVSMGWDSSPRTIQSDRYEQHNYPWTAILAGNTPDAFKTALEQSRRFLDLQTSLPKMVTINAWNEWTEGSYLLPDTQHGTAYLQAIRDVFSQA